MKHLIAPFLLAIICSSSIFASDRSSSGFGGSTTPIPSFGGGGTGAIPTFGGTKTPKPGSNPIIIDPDLLGGSSGRNPKNPLLPNLGGDVKIDFLKSLKGGDPMTAATNALIEGNSYSADRACLKAAQLTPLGQGFDDASIDAYRRPGYDAEFKTKEALASLPASVLQRFKPKGKTIFTVGNPCEDTEQKQMCRQLLGRAITDERQANYKPMSEEAPELEPALQQAKTSAAAELDRSIRSQDEADDNKVTSSPSDKTVLLLIMIDKAMAVGDKNGAQGALEVLREINPSAAHALDCLGVTTFAGNDMETTSPLTKKPKIGPITGYDYTADIEHGNPVVMGVAKELGLEGAKALFVKAIERGYEAIMGSKFLENEEERKAKLRLEYDKYIDCRSKGGAACDQVWDKGALLEQRAKEGKNVFTGEPLKKDDQGTAGPEHRVDIDLSPLPNPGDLHGGPSIGPSPERPVVDSFEMEESPISKLKTKKEREELIKNRDPHAAENYCQSVVTKFSSVHKKGLTMTFTGIDESFIATTGKKAGLGGGVMAFDQWNDEFWTGMKDFTSKLPGAQNKQNSCNSADPIKPM